MDSHKLRMFELVKCISFVAIFILGNSQSFAKETTPKIEHTKKATTFEPAPCPKMPKPMLALAKARCGFLVVPENRHKANSRKIRLNVAIIPAQSKHPSSDPLVYMAGGPGGSATPAAQLLVDAGINKNRTLIIMDQRGTTYAKPALLCPNIDSFNAAMVAMPYDAPATGKRLVEEHRKCYEHWQAAGVDLDAYNTTENAADFADLRTALHIKEWNVYGVSYGTDLALTFMSHHPEGLRSVTIDSVVPPNSVHLGMFWMNASVAFNTIFQACEGDKQCNARYPKIKNTFAQLITKLEEKPIIGFVKPVLMPGSKAKPGAKPTKVVLDGGALVNWLIGVTEMLGPNLPELITQVAHSNAEPVLASYAAIGHAHEGDYSYGLHNGVVCAEWIPYEKENSLIEEGKKAFPTFPESVLAQAPQFPFMFDICKVWKVPKGSAAQRELKDHNIPLLIISGSYDAITSPKYAEAIAQSFSKSTFALIPGIGHFVIPKSKCAQSVMGSFLENPEKPDTSCISQLKLPPFKRQTSTSKKSVSLLSEW